MFVLDGWSLRQQRLYNRETISYTYKDCTILDEKPSIIIWLAKSLKLRKGLINLSCVEGKGSLKDIWCISEFDAAIVSLW